MFLKFCACFLVGFAVASNPGWRDDNEYTYTIQGRTVAGLQDVSDQHSGILLRAKLTVRPVSDENLMAKISNAKYSQIHTKMPEGWNSYIPDSQLEWKTLDISEKYFKIVMTNGVVQDVIVDQEISNWESNVIRSIVSQFQLDTKAQNIIPSPVNTLPDGNSNTATFKTMEDTVTGNTETLYDIHLLPEYVLQNKPWLAQKYDQKSNEQVIEIVKHKNYTNGAERPSYHFGLFNMGYMEPTSNTMGQFFTRSSLSRVIITGSLNRFTIQNSFTVNKLVMRPTLVDDQKGSVVSMMNITLTEIEKKSEKPQDVKHPISLGNLVYRYNKPYGDNKVRSANQFDHQEEELITSEESLLNQGRFRRNSELSQKLFNDLIYASLRERYAQVQENNDLHLAPEAPLLPYTMAFKGSSIKQDKNFNIVETARKLSRDIGHDVQNPEAMLEEDTLAKFTTLASLCRVMDAEELREVADEVYSKEETGPRHGAWVAFRDALAETGTGPALLTVQKLIQSGKLQGDEAMNVISTMALAVREPTLEYMRTFYTICQESQGELRESALLSFTNLLRKVFVSKNQSHNKYPVHSFGSFRTEEGKLFTTKTVIPNLQEQLNKAIQKGNSHEILILTRAIGNIGHRDILQVFEPYLEGHKQCSQFQRLWMVVALDKLVKIDAVRARSVLYKIYQNMGETPEIRATAVFQIMRTAPPANLLQRMAEYTNIDTSKMVNAAVKSSIEHAASLHGKEFEQLRDGAKSAMGLLSREDFSLHQAGNHIRTFVFEELNMLYKNTLQYVGDKNSWFPKMLKFAFRSSNAGIRRQWAVVNALVSSVDELWNVVEQGTEEYKKSRQSLNNGKKNQWSSANIARLLNLKADEREQLEGLLNIEIGSLQKLITFDNKTLEHLPSLIKALEQQYEEGKTFRTTKFSNRDEIAFSFPTEMGFPFLYTYDKPTLVSVRGVSQASSKPKIVNDKHIRLPESVTGKVDLHLVVSTKIKGKLSFITPFDHEQYSAGYDRVYQVNIPLRAKMDLDVKEQQVKFEVEPLKTDYEKVYLFHVSSWPYTSVHNIMSPLPLSRTNRQIMQNEQRNIDTIFGKKSTGMALHLKGNYENMPDLTWFNILQKAMQGQCAFLQNQMQHAIYDITYIPKESSTKKLAIHFGTQHKYKSKNNDDKHDLSHLYNSPHQSMAREQDFERKSGSSMRNADIASYDATFDFQGHDNFKYTFTGAVAKSNVDPTSRVLFYFKKYSNSQDKHPYQFAISAKMHIPNKNELSVEDALKNEPNANAQVYMAFGREYQTSPKIKAEIEFSRNPSTKQNIIKHPTYQKCKEEMAAGNKQLHACAELTKWANRMDVMRVKLHHHNVNEELSTLTRSLYDVLRFNYESMVQIEQLEKDHAEEFLYEFRANPDWRSVNASLKMQGQHITVDDVKVNLGYLVKQHEVTCLVDETAIKTFNDKIHDSTMDEKWTVLFQYVPQRARNQKHRLSVEEQLRNEMENFVVLGRQVDKTRKEVKITFNTPETQGETVEVNMKTTGHSVKVIVDGQEVKITDDESYDVKHGLMEVYMLNNGEIKMVIKNRFAVIFDGSRVKITMINLKFSSSIRGICGQYEENLDKDQITSEKCVHRDFNKLIESYRVEEGKQRNSIQDRQHCSDIHEVLYANVISNIDAGRNEKYDTQLGKLPKLCSIHQTRYIEEEEQICFTRRPFPVCKCQQRGSLNKQVSVHCVPKSQVTNMWKQQIAEGLSPSFENKPESKLMQIALPQSCSL
ncbi:unnamed protein product [Brassicogethes aeneus]|uniref:Vitellogenin n=1 Tax=Brassicogethes aeneus TaxID=1431903 RepID=A0A9P0BFB3_BRAAE|nr:unnamed protein product [Brassicogethes aeneus]